MDRFEPHGYQRECIERLVNNSAVGLFLDMGLGKTVVTLTAIHELKYRMWCVRKVLVIAPKKVAEGTWTDEAAKWEHLKDLHFSLVLGNEKERFAALRKRADVYLVNRENTKWIVEQCAKDWKFDMVVIDESSSFKNRASERFKALKAVRPKISRIVELTGTPRPQSLMDLWSRLYLLDGGRRLGKTITSYRDAFFVPDKRNRNVIFSYKPKPGAEEEILRRISDICVSMKSEDYLELPERIVNRIPVKLDEAAKKRYKELEKEEFLKLEDDSVITAGTAAALTGKLLQVCNGAVYTEEGSVVELHDCKITALLETVEQLSGQSAIVCYNFKHDLDRIEKALEGSKLRIRVYRGEADKQAWNNGEVDLLLVQPASCGYGLNLQHGGHHIIWFGLTWNLEIFQQMNKRLHRQGQKHPVMIHLLVAEGGVDEDVVRSLDDKDAGQERLFDFLKARRRNVLGGGAL